MNRQLFDILNRQERAEQDIYQSEPLLLDMIRRDFADSESLLRLLDASGTGAVQFFRLPGFPAPIGSAVVPVRTGDVFSVHKHTLWQIPYFHTHDFYELVYVLRGTCTQEFRHLSAPLLLREGQACLLRPGTIHAMSRCGSGDVILKFTIPAWLFSRTAGAVLENGPAAELRVFEARTARIDFLISSLLRESFSQPKYWTAAAEAYLSLLFVELARGPEYRSSAILYQLTTYFDADPGSVTLGGFASFIGYSGHYAAKLVKQHTGRSFSEVVEACG